MKSPAREVARPRRRRLQLAVLVRRGQAHVVDAPGVAAARDDVDRAGDRARAGLGRRRAQDLDPLDLVGRQRIEREARRHALAVEQDLGVAVAEAAQADRAAAARPALDRDAGQALEDVAEGRVAEAIDLLAADDDLGGGRVAPLLDVVGAAAGDLHRRETLASASFEVAGAGAGGGLVGAGVLAGVAGAGPGGGAVRVASARRGHPARRRVGGLRRCDAARQRRAQGDERGRARAPIGERERPASSMRPVYRRAAGARSRAHPRRVRRASALAGVSARRRARARPWSSSSGP